MKKRIITGLIMLAILLPIAIFSQLLNVFDGIVTLLVLIASFELLNMYDHENKLHPIVKGMDIVLTYALFFSIINSGIFGGSLNDTIIVKTLKFLWLDNIVTPLNAVFAIFIALMFTMVVRKDFTVKDVGKLMISIIYVAVGASAVVILRHLGTRFLVYLMIITAFTDIFALVFGMLFGKHKMAPDISPKKTWEGAIGGTAVATLLGFLMLFLYSYIAPFFHGGSSIDFFDNVFNYKSFTVVGKVFFTITLSLSLSICGQIGDLVASKLKRNYGIKDYSNLFPGHGGIFDRFDSTFFASAIFVIFLLSEVSIFGV